MPTSGGRRLKHEALTGRSYALDTPERPITRKELAQAAREAERALRLPPALRMVLSELVGVWGEHTLAEGRMIVWPSNDYLVTRTGLSERSIRYAMASLTELMVITPRDSANGKRYAVRDRGGQIVDAFGFDLTPLCARRGEFAELIQRQQDLAEARRRVHDEITVCRRAAEEALGELQELTGSTDGPLEQRLEGLRSITPRRGSSGPVIDVLDAWRQLRLDAEQAFYQAANAGNDCRHLETDNGTFENPCINAPGVGAGAPPVILDPPSHPSIQLVVEACPALQDHGAPRTEAELVSLARFLRGSIGAHPSAWDEAVKLIGPVRAAAAVALVLQLHTDDVESGANHIRNPGGYFRAMVRMIGDRKIHLETEMLARLRRQRKGRPNGPPPSGQENPD